MTTAKTDTLCDKQATSWNSAIGYLRKKLYVEVMPDTR